MSEHQEDQPTQAKPKKNIVPPNPGRFPIRQKMSMSASAGEKGTFVHDDAPVRVLCDTFAARVHPFEEMYNNDPQMFDQFKENTDRMIYMMMGRKLAVSLTDDQKSRYSGYLRSVVNANCSGPSAMVPIIDLFGQVEVGDQRFEMLGQPLLAFSYMARACFEPNQQQQGFDRTRALIVNAHWPGFKKDLFDFAVGVINSWADAHPPYPFQFNNNVIVNMNIPKVRTGIAGYQVFINAIPRPPNVAWALNVAMVVEAAINAPLNDQQRNQLQAQQVWIVDWNPTMISEAVQRYSITVESRIRMAVSGATNWVPIKAFRDHGSPGQLLNKETEFIYMCPHQLGGEAIDLGWLVASKNNMVHVNNKAYHLVPKETTSSGMVTYIEGMMKVGSKFVSQ